MTELKRVEDVVRMPKGTTLDQLLRVVRRVLRLSRVTNLSLDDKGNVFFTRYARPDDPGLPAEDGTDDASIHSVILASELEELSVDDPFNVGGVISSMFLQASADQMFPVAWGTGEGGLFRKWHKELTRVDIKRDHAYGLPLYVTPLLPGDALFLCCAFARDAYLPDVRRTYKVLIPQPVPVVEAPPSPEQLPAQIGKSPMEII